MFRTLRGKLIALFALLVVSGAAVTLLVTTLNTRAQFDRYVVASDERRAATLSDILGSYYKTNGSWNGVERLLAPHIGAMGQMNQLMSPMMGGMGSVGQPSPPPGPGQPAPPQPGRNRQGPFQSRRGATTGAIGVPPNSPPPNGGGFERIILALPDGTVLVDTASGTRNVAAGSVDNADDTERETISSQTLRQAYPVTVNGKVVGKVLVGSMIDRSFSPLQLGFLRSVGLGVIISSLTVALLATILGALFLSGITRPLRKLTGAAIGMASGRRDIPIPRLGNDEVGRLASSFEFMQRALDREEQARQKLFRDVAHELRTPVTLLQGEIEAMVDGVYEIDPAVLRSLLEEVKRLSHLINDVQLLAALDAQELTLSREAVSPVRLFEQTVRRFQTVFNERGIHAVVVADEKLPDIWVDRTRFVQVLDNLLNNALVHGGDVSTIRLEAGRIEGEGGSSPGLFIRVQDDGCGIVPEEAAHIFERLYRSQDNETSHSNLAGSGLGLSISRRIVEAHGGRISVESQPGRGATFTIILPE